VRFDAVGNPGDHPPTEAVRALGILRSTVCAAIPRSRAASRSAVFGPIG
jgi:hypothetical protein